MTKFLFEISANQSHYWFLLSCCQYFIGSNIIS